jgi:hypothetical protein
MIDKNRSLQIAFWILVFLGTLPAFIYLAGFIQGGARGEAIAQPVYFRGYYGFGFVIVFVCIAWLAQQLNLWWGVFLGLPALFIGIYPAFENFGSEKLVSGAVVAFNQEGCPLGWDQYTPSFGRVMIGAGAGKRSDGTALTERKLGQAGGEEVHQLTVAEMPKHNHDYGGFKYLLQSDGNYTMASADPTAGEPNLHTKYEIQPQGGDKPHNIMPPFTVISFCQKR